MLVRDGMKTISSISPDPNQKIAPRMWMKSRTPRTQTMAAGNLASALMNLQWQPARPLSRVALEGELVRLELVDVARHSCQLFAAQSSAPDLWGYLPYGPFESVAAFRVWLTERTASSDPLFYAIIERISGQARGWASF